MKKEAQPRRAPAPIAPATLAHVAGGRFLDSDPSDANRVLERHELPGNQGG
jgi:hypothetical protein